MKIRRNITISQVMLERAQLLMRARGFDDFSEFLSSLIREEHERRGPVVTRESHAQSAERSPSKSDVQKTIADTVQQEVRRRQRKASPSPR